MQAFVIYAAMPGDANLDNKVDINDLTIVLAHYNQTGMTWTQGEFTGERHGRHQRPDDCAGALRPDPRRGQRRQFLRRARAGQLDAVGAGGSSACWPTAGGDGRDGRRQPNLSARWDRVSTHQEVTTFPQRIHPPCSIALFCSLSSRC